MQRSTSIASFTPTSQLGFARRIVEREIQSRLHSYVPRPSIDELRQALDSLAAVETTLREKGHA